ncbi:MAG: methyltransferase domain-containing protein [Chloroflexi bacterium]|nr:methyltransferase domain-containing protein [Chloroflexota bacterium]
MADTDRLLDVPLGKRQIQAFYGAAAPVYDAATVEFEARAKALALDAMHRKPGERYLEVAVGTGMSIVEQVKRTGPAGIVGIDLTPGMLSLTRERLNAAGASSVPLMLADARFLPFRNGTFDCLFNSYMLDLIPAEDIGQIVSEFRRVLKSGGRIVLANLTEGEGADVAFSEDWKARFLKDPIQVGGCRPVLAGSFLRAAGFTEVQRTYCGGTGSWPTEVVSARAPGPT